MNTSILALVLTGLFPMLAHAFSSQHSPRWNSDERGVVLAGYDVVAYQKGNKAVRGSSTFSHTYDGGTFYFSTEENLVAFQKDPVKYAPQFGGFCAFGVAANKAKVPVDPATFKIQDGKLLLFFNDVYEGKEVNTKPMWEKNSDQLYRDPVATWPTLKSAQNHLL